MMSKPLNHELINRRYKSTRYEHGKTDAGLAPYIYAKTKAKACNQCINQPKELCGYESPNLIKRHPRGGDNTYDCLGFQPKE